MVRSTPAAAAAFLGLALLPARAEAGVADLYCGDYNCYDLLGVDMHDEVALDTANIKRTFRRVAREMHPDKLPPSQREAATERMTYVNKAYEVLKDVDRRLAYNYFLANPHDDIHNYMEYYRVEYQSKMPLSWLIVGFLAFLSALQYFNHTMRHASLLQELRLAPKFAARVEQIRASDKSLSRSDVEEWLLQNEVVVGGSYAQRPVVRDLVLARLLLLPATAAYAAFGRAKFWYLYVHLQRPYPPAVRDDVTRRLLHVTRERWRLLDAREREALVARELWVPANKDKFDREDAAKRKAEEDKVKNSAAYKRFQRLKKQGKLPEQWSVHDE